MKEHIKFLYVIFSCFVIAAFLLISSLSNRISILEVEKNKEWLKNDKAFSELKSRPEIKKREDVFKKDTVSEEEINEAIERVNKLRTKLLSSIDTASIKTVDDYHSALSLLSNEALTKTARNHDENFEKWIRDMGKAREDPSNLKKILAGAENSEEAANRKFENAMQKEFAAKSNLLNLITIKKTGIKFEKKTNFLE